MSSPQEHAFGQYRITLYRQSVPGDRADCKPSNFEMSNHLTILTFLSVAEVNDVGHGHFSQINF